MPGTTALLRSANAARKKVLAQQDAQVAYDYANSAKTYDDYVRYTQYLDKRAKSITDPSTALTLRKTFDAAKKSYMSNEIQRQSINVLEGRGTNTDKYNTIYGFMKNAMDNGQYDLAQDLNLKLDNLYMTIQSEQERSYAAAERLAKTKSSAASKANLDMADELMASLGDLSRAFQKGGQPAYNKAAKQFVDSKRSMLKELGVDLPKDASTNIGQVIAGTVEGIANYYSLAADALRSTNPDRAADLESKIQDIANGKVKFATPMGDKSYEEVRRLEANPDAYVQAMKDGKFNLSKSTVFGYSYDEKGKLQTKYSGSLNEQTNRKQFDKSLQNLGFGNIQYNESTGKYTAQLTDKTAKWLKGADLGTTDRGYIELEPNATGFQFLRPDGKLYSIATDNKGLGGLYVVDPNKGLIHIKGQYGFNQKNNSAFNNTSALLTSSKFKANTQAPVVVPQQKSGLPTIAQAVINILGKKSQQSAMAQMRQRQGGGFDFIDANGRSISALTYAKSTGQQFRSVLQQMASKGDSYAATALRYAGNDGAYNPASIDLGTAKNWNALTWGNQVKLQVPQAARVANQTNSGPWATGGLGKAITNPLRLLTKVF